MKCFQLHLNGLFHVSNNHYNLKLPPRYVTFSLKGVSFDFRLSDFLIMHLNGITLMGYKSMSPGFERSILFKSNEFWDTLASILRFTGQLSQLIA